MPLDDPGSMTQQQPSHQSSIDHISEALSASSIHDDSTKPPHSDSQNQPLAALSIQTYSRIDLLRLRNSPLVHPPSNMPDLKDWFGTENEQAMLKKDSEASASSNIRERRFRRDLEDDPTRPTYRTSQPSQMGNFKHQSLRSSDRDRDRDRDNEKDRERDIRDKEGQERLRNLSDKYDRDRHAHSIPQRKQERDSAPHLAGNGTSRHSSQSQSTVAPGRTNTRESAKKKPGEASDDWRRGGEISRPGKDDQRDDRERPRSGPRDSSRSRREPSLSRRDRDDRDRERERRNDRDTRKDKDEYRRDRDRDPEDNDDPRRWRDDGKREERMAARRAERDRDLRDRERPRDRASNEPSWDISDRRWTPTEDRAKRPITRERKQEEKDRDERRESQKEKEPAWMDAYIPAGSSGILGGKLPDGELDGIQAWKKGMKEREEREKASSNQVVDDLGSEYKPDAGSKLDEIQLFKMLMKQEEAKKQKETADFVPSGASTPFGDPRSKSELLIAEEAFHSNPGSVAFIDSRVNHQPVPAKRSSQPSPANDLSVTTSPPKPDEQSTDPSKSRMFPHPVNPANAPNAAERLPNNLPSSQYTPPAASRLLAFARTPGAAPPNPRSIKDGQVPLTAEALRSVPGFSPFEEHSRASHTVDETRRNDPALNTAPDSYHDSLDTGAYGANKGSRFAKFFDGKSKDPPVLNKGPTPTGFSSSSPNPIQRLDQAGFTAAVPSGPIERTVDDIVAMLNNSAQRGLAANHNTLPNFPSGQPNSHPLQQLQPLPQHPFNQQSLHPQGRLDALYESREDRSFVPDGMVPGLRPAPPRGRDNMAIYNDDDLVVHNPPRLPPQHRNLDPLYSGPSPTVFAQQGIRNNGMPIQQPQFRGGPSPISNLSTQQLPLQSLQNQQRLPPGLANLGGRPPHEPNQFLGMPGIPGNGLPNGALQQQSPFNNLPSANGLGFGGPQQQVRPGIPAGHHLPNPGTHLGLSSIAHPGNLDMRNPSHQGPLLNLVNANAAGLRGAFPPQPGPGPQLQPPLIGLRQQQQQQQLHPHMVPHLLPPHFQQQPIGNAANQPAQDLMALLMGGPHRE